MKLGLINSAWAQAGRGTAWGIRQTKTIGFDSIDAPERIAEWVAEAYAAKEKLMIEAGIVRG